MLTFLMYLFIFQHNGACIGHAVLTTVNVLTKIKLYFKSAVFAAV